MSLSGQVQEGMASPSPEQGLPSLLEWILDTGCCVHDVHNGLKWGLFAYTTDPQLIKDIYIVIESLRNAYSLLYSHMGQWLLDKMRFVDDDDVVPRQHLEALWAALGVDSEWVDILADLGLIWRGGFWRFALPMPPTRVCSTLCLERPFVSEASPLSPTVGGSQLAKAAAL